MISLQANTLGQIPQSGYQPIIHVPDAANAQLCLSCVLLVCVEDGGKGDCPIRVRLNEMKRASLQRARARKGKPRT